MNLEVKNYYEANALWAVIMEAKFSDEPDKPELQGSPFVSDLAERTLKIVTELGDQSVKEWFSNMEVTEKSILYSKVQRKVKESHENGLSLEETSTYIKEYLRPYTIAHNTLESIYGHS